MIDPDCRSRAAKTTLYRIPMENADPADLQDSLDALLALARNLNVATPRFDGHGKRDGWESDDIDDLANDFHAAGYPVDFNDGPFITIFHRLDADAVAERLAVTATRSKWVKAAGLVLVVAGGLLSLATRPEHPLLVADGWLGIGLLVLIAVLVVLLHGLAEAAIDTLSGYAGAVRSALLLLEQHGPVVNVAEGYLKDGRAYALVLLDGDLHFSFRKEEP